MSFGENFDACPLLSLFLPRRIWMTMAYSNTLLTEVVECAPLLRHRTAQCLKKNVGSISMEKVEAGDWVSNQQDLLMGLRAGLPKICHCGILFRIIWHTDYFGPSFILPKARNKTRLWKLPCSPQYQVVNRHLYQEIGNSGLRRLSLLLLY